MKLFGLVNIKKLVIAFGLLAVLMPFSAAGQGRGRWGNKCDKFVNCHDARDGRTDGRGPRTDYRDRYYRRGHHHEWNNSNNNWRGRHYERHNNWHASHRHNN